MKRHIVIKTQFEGIHRWSNCPYEDVSFLREPHRHIFHIECYKRVSHNDREIEIIRFKREIDGFLKNYHGDKMGCMSCEMLAELLIKRFDLSMCQVLEDGENGAVIIEDQNS